MGLHNQTEEDLHRALQQSLKEPQVQPKELTVAQTMEILLRNYSERDPNALKKLCMESVGRGAELEKYLEKHFQDIPTREEAGQEKTREKAEQEKARLDNEARGIKSSKTELETNSKDIRQSAIEAKRTKITIVHQRLKFPDSCRTSTVNFTLTFRKWLMKRRRSFNRTAGQKSGNYGFFEFSYKGKRIQDLGWKIIVWLTQRLSLK